jgi:hypothetical protein
MSHARAIRKSTTVGPLIDLVFNAVSAQDLSPTSAGEESGGYDCHAWNDALWATPGEPAFDLRVFDEASQSQGRVREAKRAHLQPLLPSGRKIRLAPFMAENRTNGECRLGRSYLTATVCSLCIFPGKLRASLGTFSEENARQLLTQDLSPKTCFIQREFESRASYWDSVKQSG